MISLKTGNRPTVLFVSSWFSVHAQEYSGYTLQLVAKLVEAGWSIITTSSQPQRLIRLLDMVATTWRRRRDYEAGQVDLFSGPAFLWAEAVCWTLRRAGKPYILTLHGGALPDFAQRWPGRVRRLLRSAAKVTTPSRYLLEQMKPYRADVRLLPYALDMGCYPFRLRTHARPQIIWLRAFHDMYNPTLAPQVAVRLLAEFPDLHLTMVGPDKGDGSLQRTQQATAGLGLAGTVAFPGGVPKADVPRWLDQGDIFLNTTNVDNTPVSVMEAMACGMCIASTNVGGIPYLLEHGQDALLSPAGDADAMAAAVRRILTEPGLAERLSRNARAKAERYDWSVVLAQWGELLNSLGVRR